MKTNSNKSFTKSFVIISMLILIIFLLINNLNFLDNDTTSSLKTTKSSDELSLSIQEPHEVRMGLGMTRNSISDNLKLLNSFEKRKKTYTLLEKIKHNSSLFTQGLVYQDGLIESTGLYGESEVIGYNEALNERTIQSPILAKKYFGEGITLFDHKIIQLTWQEQTGFIYPLKKEATHQYKQSSSVSPINPISNFKYETYTGEGWGITYDKYKNELIVSDGSEYLFFWDPYTLKELRYIRITMPPCGDSMSSNNQIEHYNKYCQKVVINNEEERKQNEGGRYLKFLNELEYSSRQGYLLANVWYSNDIVLIDLEKGEVSEVYDFSMLHTRRSKKEDCFNGIALDAASGEVYVTGKLWPWIWRVKLEE